MKFSKAPLWMSSLLACALLLPLSGKAMAEEVFGFWRFEEGKSDNFPTSSGAEQTGKVESGKIKSVDLSAEGAGARFRTTENLHAIRFQEEDGSVLIPGDPALEWKALTIEALVHLSASRTDASGQTVISCGSFDKDGGTWMLGITGEQSTRGARRLVFSYQFQPGPWVTANRVAIDSGIQLQTGKDYYIAVAVNVEDPSKEGIIFYAKELGSKEPMIVVRRDHPEEAVTIASNGNDIRIGNLKSLRSGWVGLIDEVKITKRQLSEDELFVKTLQ